jgi:hypothetical protein
MAQAPPPLPPSQVVRAQRVELADERGTVRVKIGIFEEGPGIRIYDETGHCRIWLGMTFLNQPQLVFYDKVTTRAILSLDTTGEPRLALLDQMLAHAGHRLIEQQRQEDETQRAKRATKKRPAQARKKKP